MAARQQRDQGLLDHLGLTEDDLADALANEPEALAQRLDFGNEVSGSAGCRYG